MRSRLDGRAVVTVFLGGLVGVALWQTLGLAPGARLVPLTVAVPTLALIVFQLALDLFPELGRRFALLDRDELVGVKQVREQVHPESLPVREHPTPEDPAEPPSGEAAAFGWMGAMLASAWLLGFALGGPLFAFVYIRFRGRRGARVAAAVAAGLGLAIVAVFDWAFDAPLWRGQLWTWLGL